MTDTPEISSAPAAEEILKGISVSSGIAIGEAYLIQRLEVEFNRYLITPAEVPLEVSRFRKALTKSKSQLREIRDKIAQEIGDNHSYIIDTHLLMLKDSMLIDGVIGKIQKDLVNAESALAEVMETFRGVFRRLKDEYLRERHSDVEDVFTRIMRNLAGHRDGLDSIPPRAIVIATDLAPSETAQMNKERIQGFATELGGKTSHTAIMARSLEIPAVVGLDNVTRRLSSGTPVIIDGNAGIVVINPGEETLREYRSYLERYRYYEHELSKIRRKPAQTVDGQRIKLLANIELPHEAAAVLDHGADGVGLYRTEFLYMNRTDLPSEDEHFETYRTLAASLKGRPATIRTLDLGGDKYLSQIPMSQEINPALGLRAIRLCLQERGLFKDQLRGILRASHFGKLRVMFPMISGLEELRGARAILEECKAELRAAGKPFDEGIQVGSMIETPVAVTIADLLARECDFFSIGTNDLIQYSLAIDRINLNVAYLYKPHHPGVLRSIGTVIRAAGERGVPVAMCGEMAGEPIYAVILIGMGLRELSMNPIAVPRVKKIILSLALDEAREMAEKAKGFSTAEEVEDFITERMVRRFPADISADGRQICLL